jgi:uncharacterized protein YkwD
MIRTMSFPPRPFAACAPLLLLALLAATPARANLQDDIQVLRTRECRGADAPAAPLRRQSRLDEAARQRAQGRSLHDALADSGYVADHSTLLHASGSGRAVRGALRESGCKALADAGYVDLGLYERNKESWIVLAAPYRLPSAAEAPAFAATTLQLVNEARARGARCGSRMMPPAPPLASSSRLDTAAAAHAQDMAMYQYFDHRDHRGRLPMERTQEIGYHGSVVGENIAYGPSSPGEVVAGWLASPGHCENMLDARFTEMGLAFAAGHGERRPALYWVQELGLPQPQP